METSEEYQKLYSLLAGLASKGVSNTNDGTNPQLSLRDLLIGEKKVEKKPERSASAPRMRRDDYSEPTIIHRPLPKEVATPPKMTTIRETRTVAEVLEHIRRMKEEKKQADENAVIQCDACEKVFISTITQKNHLKHSIPCQKWLKLPHRKLFLVPPLHELVDEWLHQAISLPDQIICQYCSTSFCNKGNLHKHYQTSTVCNRLGYLRFLEIIRSK